MMTCPGEEKIGGRKRWEVESDLRALRDARKIQRDSKRTSAVKLLVKEEMGALEELAHEKGEFNMGEHDG